MATTQKRLWENCCMKHDTNKDGKVNLIELTDILLELDVDVSPLDIMMKFGEAGKLTIKTFIDRLEQYAQVSNNFHTLSVSQLLWGWPGGEFFGGWKLHEIQKQIFICICSAKNAYFVLQQLDVPQTPITVTKEIDTTPKIETRIETNTDKITTNKKINNIREDILNAEAETPQIMDNEKSPSPSPLNSNSKQSLLLERMGDKNDVRNRSATIIYKGKAFILENEIGEGNGEETTNT